MWLWCVMVRHHEFGRNAEAFGYDLVVELALLEGLDLVAVLGDHAARAAERAEEIVDRTLLHHSVSQSAHTQKMKRLRARVPGSPAPSGTRLWSTSGGTSAL